MKSLERVQKICKVLKVLAKIVFICSIVSTCLFGSLSILFIIFGNNLDVINYFASIDLPYEFNYVLCLFVGITIESAFSIALYRYVVKFYNFELELGNPFDKPLIKEMRKLGILHIVLPIVSSIITAIFSGIFGYSNFISSAFSGVTMGVVYLLLSCVIEYGSELKRK